MMPWNTACTTLELDADHAIGDVQAAFRQAARRWHPDSSGTGKTERQFAQACEAKDRLTIYRHLDDEERPAADAPEETLDDVLSKLYECEVWDWLLCKIFPHFRKPGLYRRDTKGIATVWFVRVEWTSFTHREDTTLKFKFPVDDEPAIYQKLVAHCGPPKMLKPRRRKRRRAPSTAVD